MIVVRKLKRKLRRWWWWSYQTRSKVDFTQAREVMSSILHVHHIKLDELGCVLREMEFAMIKWNCNAPRLNNLHPLCSLHLNCLARRAPWARRSLRRCHSSFPKLFKAHSSAELLELRFRYNTRLFHKHHVFKFCLFKLPFLQRELALILPPPFFFSATRSEMVFR